MSERLIVFPRKVGGRTYLWEYGPYIFTIDNATNKSRIVMKIQDGKLVLNNTYYSGGVGVDVDLTNFSKYVICASATVGNGIVGASYFGPAGASSHDVTNKLHRQEFTATEKVYTVDVSDMTGYYKLWLGIASFGGECNLVIKYMYFE